LGLRLSTAEHRTITPRISAWGRVVADAANERTVTAPADGWVRHLYVQSAGTRIAAGAPLFEFYSPELAQRQRDYIDALNRRDQLLKSMTDMRGQNGEMLGSLARERKRQRDALLRLGIAQASIDTIETFRRPLETLTIVSTHAGLVTAVNAREGAAVGPAGLLYGVLDDRAVQLDVILTPSQFDALVSPVWAEVVRSGKSTRIPLPLDRAVFNGALQSYVVRAKLVGQIPMQPGSVLDVDVIGRTKNTLAIPREAILDGPDGSFVVTMIKANSFAPRRITLGVLDRDWVEIHTGLSVGDKVVADGQFMLDAAATFKSTFAGAVAH
jgi:Cu(I)/Ag(I) efflux system membrane fusion protein